MDEILDVDLLAFEHRSPAQRRAVTDGVMASLRTGFVYTAHDLSGGLLDEAYDVLGRFFALEPDTKARYVDAESFGARGYTGPLTETAAVSDLPDWKEMFNWSDLPPAGHPLTVTYGRWYRPSIFPDDEISGAAEILTEFHRRLVELQRRFLRVIAEGIGAHETYFDRMTTFGTHLSRAIHYPPMSHAPAAGAEGHIWADEHADINLITALPRATERGLQVQIDGEWVDAAPPDDHVIINSGIMLEHVTNGLIGAGWHRVKADPAQRGSRLSVVQFCHPRPSTILTPAPSTVGPDRPCRYEAVSAEDRLEEVIWEINLIPDARRVE
ncbi:isopenicillin N synthase family dioxygenase [Candidatus Poriferisodalis sp.]|uniref:isopenicillin N synthase family dioxygenase n=1 Tax=Candidatus Poriferisodalis sp. TaxID=3101277 RepID=UPI003B021903